MTKLVATFFLFVLLMTSQGLAGNWSDCQNSDAKTSIKGCTAIIKARRDSNRNFAIANYNRGIAYRSLKQLDLAIADFDDASGAMKEFDTALQIDPDYGYAYVQEGRGGSRFGLWCYERILCHNKSLSAPTLTLPTRRRGPSFSNSRFENWNFAPKNLKDAAEFSTRFQFGQPVNRTAVEQVRQ